MLAPVSATGRVMQIGMTSKDHSLIEMSMMAYWTIRARLLRVPGVANVAIWDERLQMMTVQVEPPKLAAQGVTLDQVMEATADAVDSGLLQFSNGSVIGTGGIDRDPEPADRRPQRPADRHARPTWPRVPVTGERGTTVRLGDVADGGGGSPAADRRRDHQRRAGAAARRREAAVGQHACR